MDWVSFVSVVAIPALFLITSMMVTLHWRAMGAVKDARDEAEQAKDALANYKVEVAEKYATNKALKEVEERLMRIAEVMDKKLDRLLSANICAPARQPDI